MNEMSTGLLEARNWDYGRQTHIGITKKNNKKETGFQCHQQKSGNKLQINTIVSF
jgi:hypothetical protein